MSFHDDSTGSINQWKWEFGDGETSTEPHPVHRYARGGEFTVTLGVEGPSDKARHSKVWDLFLPE